VRQCEACHGKGKIAANGKPTDDYTGKECENCDGYGSIADVPELSDDRELVE
jgi:DnaJ-class molecular chaperone